MKIVLLTVLFAVTQATPPVPRQTADNPAHTAANVKDNSQNNKTATRDSVTVVKAPANGPTQDNGSQQDDKDAQHDISVSKLPTVSVEPDYGMYIFSGLLVLVGVLQVWLLYRTWGQIERQAGIMQRQTVLMEGQINKERARIRIDLKPLKLQQPDPGDGETAQVIKYTVTFYGFTYAFIDEDVFDAKLSDSPEAGDRGLSSIGSVPSKVIVPGTAPEERIEALDTTQFEVDSLMHGKSFIHFRGRIKYRDFAEIDRETTICCVWRSWGPRKGSPPSILGGSGRWEKIGPPEANHET